MTQSNTRRLITEARMSPLSSTYGAFTPVHSTVTPFPFAPQGGETRWDGTTWTGPFGAYLGILKGRLNDGQGAGANIAIGFVVNGSEYLTWRTVPTNANRDSLLAIETFYLTPGQGLHAEVFVDNATDVGFQDLTLFVIPI